METKDIKELVEQANLSLAITKMALLTAKRHMNDPIMIKLIEYKICQLEGDILFFNGLLDEINFENKIIN